MVIVAVLLGLLAGAAVGVVVAAVVVRAVRRDAVAARAADEAARQQAVAEAVARLADERDAAVDAAVASAVDRVTVVAAERLAAHTQVAVETVTTIAGAELATQARAASGELDLRQQTFEQRVHDMNGELRQLRGLVAQLQQDKAAQHGELTAGLAQAVRTSTELASTTQALREALSSSRARGQWGERMADDVLRLSGLVEGISYRKQVTLPGGSRPDVTFLLPEGRVLHMDVKFPIDNYLRHLEATSAAERDEATKAFLRDVRNRIKELTGRGYADPETTVGYVLLFIPNESVYAFVHEHDPELLDVALGHQVVMCSPFTLFAVLGVVRQSVETFQLARTSDDILRCLGDFTKQWDAFADKLDTLGKQLGTVQRSYDDLSGVRKRQLTRHLDEIDRLRTRHGLVDPVEVASGASDAGAADLSVGDDAPPSTDGDPRVALEPVADLEPYAEPMAVNGSTPAPSHPAGPGGSGAPGRRVTRLRPVRGR
ncbi:MAG: DNA recombination protein RmuC [Acidimicrobiales bacterium]